MEDKRAEASSSSSTLPSNFPIGLRVLVVEDDPVCLMVVEKMLRKCGYQVTTCEHPAVALSKLREKRDEFDIILADVYMQDINGFELLHMVKEMDLPVVMMSANCDVNAAKSSLECGACYYLMKPVPLKELKNVWQHTIRKWKEDQKDTKVKGSAGKQIEQMGSVKVVTSKDKKRKNGSDGDKDDWQGDTVNVEQKERLVWNTSLHAKFLSAINQIGLERAAPKKIHELLNEPGLTRTNVASHLQKYRQFLRRIRTTPASELKKSNLKWLPTQTSIPKLPGPIYNPMGLQPPVASDIINLDTSVPINLAQSNSPFTTTGFGQGFCGSNMMADLSNKGKMPVSTEEDDLLIPDLTLPSWDLDVDCLIEQLQSPMGGVSSDIHPSSGTVTNNMVINQAQDETGHLIENFDLNWLFEDE